MPSDSTRPVLAKAQLLSDLLKRVSRSFYLTLRVLPGNIRDQIALAYLFARAADTIADTDVLEQARRLRLLRVYKRQFEQEQASRTDLQDIQQSVLPHQALEAERVLIGHIEDCFRVFDEFSAEDRGRIRTLMANLTPGMEMDLTLFPGETGHQARALQTMDDLDRYIYHVAGCVGEFWTQMTCAHVPALTDWDVQQMSAVGVRFGKGLQLTNVLKDLARDLQRGRCYVPDELLREVRLKPKDLMKAANLPVVRPILNRLTSLAIEHLDQGWQYMLSIPPKEVRLRLACMWPILFGGETLRRVSVSPDLLSPSVNVKMTRVQVYRIMALTALTGANGDLWTAYWGRLRKSIV